jgi:predicted transcriptional regulator
MSKGLRDKVLLLLEEHARTGSPYLKEDKEIADRLGVSVGEIQRQLDILESQGLIGSANAREGHRARISPQGSLVVEELEGLAEEHRVRFSGSRCQRSSTSHDAHRDPPD